MRHNEQLLRDLLAVIHQDAGYYTKAVGLEQSCRDAVREIADLRAANEELEKTYKAIEKRELRLGRPRQQPRQQLR